MKTRCPAAPNPVVLPSPCIRCRRLYDPYATPGCNRAAPAPPSPGPGYARTPLSRLVSPPTLDYLTALGIATLGQLVATRLEGVITDSTPTDTAVEAMHAYEKGYKSLAHLAAPKPKARSRRRRAEKPAPLHPRPPRDQRIIAKLAKAGLTTSISNLGLSKPAQGYLLRAGIKTLGQLARADLSTVIEKKTTVDTIAQLCQAHRLGQNILPQVDEDAQAWIELGI